jgi:penicillin-binding protein 1A
MFAQYGNETYTRGLNVYTTIKSPTRTPPTRRLRRGIMDFERRQIYRGPEKFVDLPSRHARRSTGRRHRRCAGRHPDNGDVMSAVVLAKPNAETDPGRTPERRGAGDHRRRPANRRSSGLSDKAPPNIKIRRGAVIRVAKTAKAPGKSRSCPRSRALSSPWTRATARSRRWSAASTSRRTSSTGSPRHGASLDPASSRSSIRPRSKRVHGLHADQRRAVLRRCRVTGGQVWEPKNYDGKFDGPMRMRRRWPSPRTWSRSGSCRRSGRATRRTTSPASASTRTSTRPT